jgi:hypothetical protein
MGRGVNLQRHLSVCDRMGTFPHYRNSFCNTRWGQAYMKPELRRVVFGLMIAGCAFAIVLTIVRVHPADLAAPGLKFVSPGISRN